MINLKTHARTTACAVSACAMALVAGSAAADEIQTTYSVGPGATSLAIPIPAANTPISITCVQNAVGARGVGQVTLLRATTPPAFLEWVGVDIATSAVTSGFSSSAGTHIIYCDYTGTVDMQVRGTSAIQIVNTGAVKATGVITFSW
jgi:hypothetical protein